MYSLIRSALFQLNPEKAHQMTMMALDAGHRLGVNRCAAKSLSTDPIEVMGLQFPNKIGLAAGLDKNGDHIDALADLGFGFIEIGTVTPRSQPGNPKPRMFRLPDAEAIINRMGFNNLGVEYLVSQVQAAQYRGILGINIGKNFDTPMEEAASDYLKGLERVYGHASYVTINISSPNTANLRELQRGSELGALLEQLKEAQRKLAQQHEHYVPLVVKIAPDMEQEELESLAQALLSYEVDGVIATNTTIARDAVADQPHGDEAGGLSGATLTQRSTEVVAQLYQILGEQLPIIAAGGVMSVVDAQQKIAAGAKLVQIYTGLIYRGPALVSDIAQALNVSSAK